MRSAMELKAAAELAAQCGVPIDRLPYTDEFSRLHGEFVAIIGYPCTLHKFWWCMLDARKRGLLKSIRHRNGAQN